MNKATKNELNKAYEELDELRQVRFEVKEELRDIDKEMFHLQAVIARLKIHGVEK